MPAPPEIRVLRWHPGHVEPDQLDEARAVRCRAFAGTAFAESEEAAAARRPTAHDRWVRGRSAPPGALMHVARVDGRVVAVANSFLRRVVAEGRPPFDVVALGGVGTEPESRGRGFGRAVVRDALDRVTAGEASCCLFQTGAARGFYEALGCVPVSNRFCNGLSRPPDPRPFVDEVVMRWPASAPWPRTPVDLRGPGW